MKKALISGITGQDGSYLSELLLEKGYEVHGIIRRSSSFNTSRIDHIFNDLQLHYGDLVDSQSLNFLVNDIKPDEIYNLGAQSHVKVSFEIPDYTAQVDALGTLRFLESIRNCKLENKTKFYQASTSELYGLVQEVPQNENTPFYPRSPYGVAKLYGYWIVKNYREAYQLHASSGILFNHESPRRGDTFVTKKITKGLSKIKLGLQEKITLGNIYSKRDWGHAKDFCNAMWLIMQQSDPDDYVISTDEQVSVKDFINLCCKLLEIENEWKGKGLEEVCIDKNTGKIIIDISSKYFRPTEVETLLGDSTKARKKLGWSPSYSLESLAKEMVEYDLSTLKK